jgi:O-6-methylguanine DNA methyltransferase
MSTESGRGRCTWSEGPAVPPRRLVVRTRAGEIGLLVLGPALGRVLMPGAAKSDLPDCPWIGEDELPRELTALPGRLRDYFAGEAVDLADLPVRLRGESMSPFARRVYERLRQVPRGETVTYGELARDSGSPRAARAVGGLMARNPWPLVVPCHRVLPAGGGWGGFSAPGGVTSKVALLQLEGGLRAQAGARGRERGWAARAP